jgi:hypothetical protein
VTSGKIKKINGEASPYSERRAHDEQARQNRGYSRALKGRQDVWAERGIRGASEMGQMASRRKYIGSRERADMLSSLVIGTRQARCLSKCCYLRVASQCLNLELHALWYPKSRIAALSRALHTLPSKWQPPAKPPV